MLMALQRILALDKPSRTKTKKTEVIFLLQSPLVTPDEPISNTELEELKTLAELKKAIKYKDGNL